MIGVGKLITQISINSKYVNILLNQIMSTETIRLIRDGGEKRGGGGGGGEVDYVAIATPSPPE